MGMLDTSPMYIYFLIVPSYYIIYFGCLMGFNMHFYIIFGTNLLTEGPLQIVVFSPISVFHRKGISNGIQTEQNLHEDLFWNKHNPGDLEYKSESPRSFHEAGGAPRGVGVPPTLVGPMELHQHTSFTYIYPCTLKTSRRDMKP